MPFPNLKAEVIKQNENELNEWKNEYKLLRHLLVLKISVTQGGGEWWQTDHVPVSLCLLKCQTAIELGSFTLRSLIQSKISGAHKVSMTRWVSVRILVCKIIPETAAITPNFAQWLLCICPVLPPPCLAECGNDRVVWQLHLPQVPPAVPWQPTHRVEHQRPRGPQGQTLLHPLQRGTLKPVWIWLHPGTHWKNTNSHYVHWSLSFAG